MGRIFSGCLTRLVLTLVAGLVFMWVVVVALNPWALHIGGRATPLLYWHGVGTVRAMNGTVLPLYVSFWPDRPGGVSGVGRREGRIVSARLQGNAWLCVAPGSVERMNVSGTMYGGYAIIFFLILALWPMAVLVAVRFGRRFSVRQMLVVVAIVAIVFAAIVMLAHG